MVMIEFGIVVAVFTNGTKEFKIMNDIKTILDASGNKSKDTFQLINDKWWWWVNRKVRRGPFNSKEDADEDYNDYMDHLSNRE